MLSLFYRALNNKKGFTLIEVLVVVAIIGILAALAAPRVMQRIEDARISSDRAAMKILNDAIVTMVLDNAVNPREVEGGGEWTTADITWGELKTYLDSDSQNVYKADDLGDDTTLGDIFENDIEISGKSKTPIVIGTVEENVGNSKTELIHKFKFAEESGGEDTE